MSKMDGNGFNLGLKRRRIEDAIMQKFREVDFKKRQRAWLEDETFWNYIFSWYELAKYYEDHTDDTAIGAHMIDLYMDCVQLFREAATDGSIRERRRDKAADALYQINYYVNQMMLNVNRNANQADDDAQNAIGHINWT
jgi:hypothetical protein